jgi:pimeloyl-[acyl-carrier protein] methyl ester esterase
MTRFRGKPRVLVLPGMHGTTNLLNDFAAVAPDNVRVELVPLPARKLDYAALASHFAATIRLDADTVLVAESFSGPLAIMLADRCEVAGLVLCNTFAEAPYPSVLRFLPLSLFTRIAPPPSLIRYFAVGPDASSQLVSRVRTTIASVPHDVMAFRTRCVLTVDVTSELARCTAPILYLRGSADRIVRDWSVNEIVAAAPSAVSVARVAGPHLVLSTAPREAWRAINEFLETL